VRPLDACGSSGPVALDIICQKLKFIGTTSLGAAGIMDRPAHTPIAYPIASYAAGGAVSRCVAC
jgi:hypothetical protein